METGIHYQELTRGQQSDSAQGESLATPAIGFTETETANYLKLKVYTLRKWRRHGTGPCYVRCGLRAIRYLKADIDQWLNQHKFNSSAHELSKRSAQ